MALDVVTERLLAEGDARAAFPDIYGIITRRVAESVELGDGAFFYEPRWISRLAGRFCERYLETLRWSIARTPQDCGAWDIAYGACARGGHLPLQHLALGVSAHINFDLAIGIYRTLVEVDGATEPAALERYKHDYDRVNDILQDSIPEIFAHFIARHHCDATRVLFRHAYTVSRWAALFIVTSWRERVWSDVLEMLHAPTTAARDRVVQRMERRSRRYAQLLAVPIPTSTGKRLPSQPPEASVGLLSALL